MQEHRVWLAYYFHYGSHLASPRLRWSGCTVGLPELYWQAIETALLDDAAHLKKKQKINKKPQEKQTSFPQ